ncbi:MAG: tyrosine-type recombinase/integrase [Planctomycetota bacterium]
MHVQEALQAFLVQLEADGRSRHTIGQYRRHVRALADWLPPETAITAITPDAVARFFASPAAKNTGTGSAKKAVSVNAMRTSIRCFAAHLHDAGLVVANPARLLRRARCTPPPPKALHQDELARLQEVLATAIGVEAERDRVLVELLLGTGIRIGSAIAIDVEDIDFDHGEVRLRSTKNDRPATVVLPKDLATRIRGFLGQWDTGPLFHRDGRRLSVRHAQRVIGRLLATAGIRGRSAHALRHTFATDLLARTGNLRLVQAALNHASIASTTVYAQVDREGLRRALLA